MYQIHPELLHLLYLLSLHLIFHEHWSNGYLSYNYDICEIIYKFYVSIVPKLSIKLNQPYIRIYKNLDLYFFIDKVVKPYAIDNEKYDSKKGHCLKINYPLWIKVLKQIKNRNIFECYENEIREPTYEETYYINS